MLLLISFSYFQIYLNYLLKFKQLESNNPDNDTMLCSHNRDITTNSWVLLDDFIKTKYCTEWQVYILEHAESYEIRYDSYR